MSHPTCNPFDHALLAAGPPAVFLFDKKGELRFDATWTRDAWGRAPGPHERGEVWLLLRDHGTGFISLVLVTSETLIIEHPRADVRRFATREEAEAARSAFGTPPVCREAW
jgi:hypothetical protein